MGFPRLLDIYCDRTTNFLRFPGLQPAPKLSIIQQDLKN
jgi:hypothetical protein